DLAHAVLHRPAGGRLGGHLGREGGGLAGSLEADVAGGRPRHHVSALVGERDDGVVEAALDVRDAVADVLALAPAGATAPGRLGLGHLLADLLLAGDGLLGSLAGAGVGLGALAAHGQALAVPQALPRADLHLALDVLLHLAAQITLDLERGLDVGADAGDLVVGEVVHAGVGADVERPADLGGAGAADAEDVGERDLDPLLARDVDAGDACHSLVPPSPGAACGAGWCR